MNESRCYYSTRNRTDPKVAGFDLATLRERFVLAFCLFMKRWYFSQELRYDGNGKYLAGADEESIGAYVHRKTGKGHLWPVFGAVDKYEEDDVFDLIEFLGDHVVQPGRTSVDENSRAEWRREVNSFLQHYKTGFELCNDGLVRGIALPGLQDLLSAPFETFPVPYVEDRIQSAIAMFREKNASADTKRIAVRELGDACEAVRDRIKELFNRKDEADLFNLLNNFGIRHYREDQRSDYDPDIFLDWIFYYYLVSLRSFLRIIGKRQPQTPTAKEERESVGD